MVFEVRCKQGKLQITENGYLQVVSFGKTIWQVPCGAITAFGTKDGMMATMSIIVRTPTGDYSADMIVKKELERFWPFFAQIPVAVVEKEQPAAREKPEKPAKPRRPHTWYEDEGRLTHIGTYTHERIMQMEVEAAYQHGWIIQGQSGQGGRISGSKVIAGAIIAGPVGAMIGAKRDRDKTTITFVRSPEWLAAHQSPSQNS